MSIKTVDRNNKLVIFGFTLFHSISPAVYQCRPTANVLCSQKHPTGLHKLCHCNCYLIGGTDFAVDTLKHRKTKSNIQHLCYMHNSNYKNEKYVPYF